MTRFYSIKQICLGCLLLTGAGCTTVGPDYQRPELDIPVAYSEEAPWKKAEPADALPKGAWWGIYGDPTLNHLQQQAHYANPNIQAAAARLEQARAAARISRTDLYPRIDLAPFGQRGRTADDLSATGQGFTSSAFQVPFDLGYEVDLWGRVQRSVEAATAEYQATAADLENLLLILHAEVARNYFALRALDAEIAVLEQSVELRKENLELVRSLFEHGQVGRLDLARAQTELATAQADAEGVRRQRAQIEHALAVLVGENVAGFTLPQAPLDLLPPAVAPGLPSRLIERRPDVAAAERRLQAANARIGVAEAAFFPAISLTGSAGFGSDELASLFSWGNRAWSLGPAISLPVFDAGRNRAGLQRALAAYDEAVSRYRQNILVAFREVEDALSDLRILADQAAAQERAVVAAHQAADLSEKRYRAGMVSYLEVVDSQRTALSSQRLATRIRGQQLQASVSLIKALGGSWQQVAD